jgi:hypothetical protein
LVTAPARGDGNARRPDSRMVAARAAIRLTDQALSPTRRDRSEIRRKIILPALNHIP